MLEEIIKEHTATKNDDCITSGGMLAWAKTVEAQRAQATVLNILTETKQFDKIKISQKVKEYKIRTPDHTMAVMYILWGDPPAKAVPSIWQNVFRVQQNRTCPEDLP